jgi:hypothetical protein
MTNRILLVDDNKVSKYLDEYPQSTIQTTEEFLSRKSYPTIDHTQLYYQDNISLISKFDGRDIWADFLSPSVHVYQTSWNTAVTRALSSRFSILSAGQIMPKINYSQLMYCPVRELMVTDEKMDKFKRSVYYALNYMYVYGTSHVGCFNYRELVERGYAKFEDFNSVDDMITRYDSCRTILGNNFSQCLDNTDARYFRSVYNINLAPNIETIKWEIVKFGPVVSVMNIYEDFKYYNGINKYDEPSGELIGSRSVTIIGWIEIDNEEYWIVDPNLGVAWGIEGYFYMKMNIKKCELEENVVSLYPDLPIFSDYILNFYKNYPIDSKLTELRSKIKVDKNSFLLEGRKNFILKNYPDIKINFIQDNLLPDYNVFFAKDVEYYTFKTKKQSGGISLRLFNFILFLIIILGVFAIFYKKK